MKLRAFRWPHFWPLLLLFVVCSLYWHRVLDSQTVLLPDSLQGFAPFGSQARAPWNILQWDALAQYFPWRTFAARELHQGRIPLWNPHQFAGTPFLANGQSAVFYPLSWPFWTMDVARAFGVSAWIHSLLAAFSTYFLCQNWKLSRAASLLAAIAFTFCGFLTFWISLPTLANTASWLPLLILLFERATVSRALTEHVLTERATAQRFADAHARNSESVIPGGAKNLASAKFSAPLETTNLESGDSSEHSHSFQNSNRVLDGPKKMRQSALFGGDFCAFVAALACAFLAGHPQIFFYCLVALGLRALTLPFSQWKRALGVGIIALLLTLGLCAIQILPTLELARLGHRAGQSASASGWDFVAKNALQIDNLSSLFEPFSFALSTDENKGYVGLGVLLLSFAAVALTIFRLSRREKTDAQSAEIQSVEAQSSTRIRARGFVFALVLALFGVFYALASPLSKAFYFGVPGLSQMGGVGRALCLWSLGAALLAAFGLDAARARWKTPVLPLVALLVVGAELFAASWNTQPTSARAQIYPETRLTQFLQSATKNGARVLFWTPRRSWLTGEILALESARSGAPVTARQHPEGVLPPNGATVFGINDVNGYDSLSSGAFRQFLIQNEGSDVSPPLNGNMVLLNNFGSPALDILNVRFVVVPQDMTVPPARAVFAGDGCVVFERNRVLDISAQKSGRDFFPGWTNDKYNPSSFRLGSWFSLISLGFLSVLIGCEIASWRARSRN